MEEALQRRVQRYGWDKAAMLYEGSWQEQLKPAHDKLFEMASIQPGDKIIDIACGTGLISFPALALTGENGFLLGTDISDKMVELCRQTATGKQISNAQFERMDAEALDAKDERYDLALCALGLMYVPSPVNALKEMYRVLKPGGRSVSAVWGSRANCGWAEIFEIVDKRVSSEVCPMFFNTGNEGVLQKCMEAAGFTDIKTERIKTILHYQSGEEACIAAFEGGPVALAYHKFSDEVKQEACKEYLASIEPYREGNTYHVPGEFVIGMGMKE